jgi:hypothetical protein
MNPLHRAFLFVPLLILSGCIDIDGYFPARVSGTITHSDGTVAVGAQGKLCAVVHTQYHGKTESCLPIFTDEKGNYSISTVFHVPPVGEADTFFYATLVQEVGTRKEVIRFYNKTSAISLLKDRFSEAQIKANIISSYPITLPGMGIGFEKLYQSLKQEKTPPSQYCINIKNQISTNANSLNAIEISLLLDLLGDDAECKTDAVRRFEISYHHRTLAFYADLDELKAILRNQALKSLF